MSIKDKFKDIYTDERVMEGVNKFKLKMADIKEKLNLPSKEDIMSKFAAFKEKIVAMKDKNEPVADSESESTKDGVEVMKERDESSSFFDRFKDKMSQMNDALVPDEIDEKGNVVKKDATSSLKGFFAKLRDERQENSVSTRGHEFDEQFNVQDEKGEQDYVK